MVYMVPAFAGVQFTPILPLLSMRSLSLPVVSNEIVLWSGNLIFVSVSPLWIILSPIVILLVVDIALVLVYPSIALKFTTSTPLPKISSCPSPSCTIPVSLSPIARKTFLLAGVPPGVTPPNPKLPVWNTENWIWEY